MRHRSYGFEVPTTRSSIAVNAEKLSALVPVLLVTGGIAGVGIFFNPRASAAIVIGA
ncbi:MAG: hypothetical protein SGI72_04305 [Planctomycetota bacterium]|nr:hypothetical protein [Planctomycetota bacterium]